MKEKKKGRKKELFPMLRKVTLLNNLWRKGRSRVFLKKTNPVSQLLLHLSLPAVRLPTRSSFKLWNACKAMLEWV